ncbi:SLC13 family permease [Paracoccus litorisediminis]|uniref:SLC13 family permease n=1 Tax=Paracoccus litorisediminis TaxID=2006130 RepID=A0A844HXZ0_9RHOB|nr:SLC13 family permease [Paracoccus litorisediminis]MTH62322.1 SLC13 family permease [Paracoccus litorisediminis]
MTTDLAIVLALLAAAIAMFAANRPRMDVVAILTLVALPLTGIISVEDALAGFSDPNIILIAALFVLGEALVRSGVAQRTGDLLVRHSGASDTRLIVLLMAAVAGMGAFMSSTGVVAIFIPIVLRITANIGAAPGRLMMPLSAAALISGMMTLVATAPNLVLDSLLRREGYQGFGFFDFTPFGLPILLLGIGYMLFARRWLADKGPAAANRGPRLADWIDKYGLAKREFRLCLGAQSTLVGKRLDQLDLRGAAGINILGIERSTPFGRRLILPKADTLLQADDVLFLDVFGKAMDIEEFCRQHGLRRLPISGAYFTDQAQEIGMAEMIVPPGSPLVGSSIAKSRFRSVHGLAIVGLRRDNLPVGDVDAQTVLRGGDVLLTVGPWDRIRQSRHSHDLVVLALPGEMDEVLKAPFRTIPALAVLTLVVVMMITGVVPNVLAALIGCLLMGLFGCVDMPSAYRSIHWQSLVLIVGMLPFSLALEKTGGVELAAEALRGTIGDANLRIALAVIFVTTVVLGLFISNTATAVLMGPVALTLATDMGASPYPFAMTVALAASAAFLTPVSSPVNTLVMGPGGYRFWDFTRIGLPLVAIVLVVAVGLVPVIFPFHPG